MHSVEPIRSVPIPARPVVITSIVGGDVEVILPLRTDAGRHTLTLAWNRHDDLDATAVLVEPLEMNHDAYLALVMTAGAFCRQRFALLATCDPRWAVLWREADLRLAVYYAAYTAAREEDEHEMLAGART